jgi:hypothetical protein
MQNSFRFDVKTRWLLLATTTLVVYCVVPIRRNAMFDLDAISTWLRILLFALTFPLGTFFVMFVNALAGFFDGTSVDGYSISGGGGGVVEQFQMWAIAVAGGFLQWFFIIPTLLGRRRHEVTALNLSSGGAAPVAAAAAAHAPVLLNAGHAHTPDAPPVPQFDERGRTPFERILSDDDARTR